MSISLDQVKKAVDDFFSDTSRSKDETKDGLEDIEDYARTRADSIEVGPVADDEDDEEDDPEPDKESWISRAAAHRVKVSGCTDAVAQEAAHELFALKDELFMGLTPEEAMQEDIDNT